MVSPIIPPLPNPEHHWVVPHHFSKLDADAFIKAFEVIKHYQGANIGSLESPDRVGLNRELGKILSEDKRKDQRNEPDPFRDYQQVYTHLGIIYPHGLVSNQLRLTPLAEQVTAGSSSLAEFLLLQAFGYQYPNGANDPKKTREYIASKTLIKPILLIYQVLTQLSSYQQNQGFLLRDEIVTFLVPQAANNNVPQIVTQILNSRTPSFGSNVAIPYRYPSEGKSTFDLRMRTTQEMMQLLKVLPYFVVSGSEAEQQVHIEIPKNERVGYQELEVLTSVEIQPDSFFHFKDASSATRLAWYDEYYSNPKRRTRWYQQAQKLTGLLSQPPTIELRETTSDQIRTPITISPSVRKSTPERTAKLQERRIKAHQHIVTELSKKIEASGRKVQISSDSVDVAAIVGNAIFFFEVKSLAEDQSDSVAQVRSAVGQLEEYRYRYLKGGEQEAEEDSLDVKLCLVLDSYPEAEPWIIKYLMSDRRIMVCWWDDEAARFQFPTDATELLSFLL